MSPRVSRIPVMAGVSPGPPPIRRGSTGWERCWDGWRNPVSPSKTSTLMSSVCSSGYWADSTPTWEARSCRPRPRLTGATSSPFDVPTPPICTGAPTTGVSSPITGGIDGGWAWAYTTTRMTWTAWQTWSTRFCDSEEQDVDVVEFLARVSVGTALAALLGIEREANRKAAGLRTYAMVGLGSAVFTIISMEAFGSADPSRVAAQIVSGIGFLGAGAIFRSGPLVKGLTTAAGLWAAAAIGMAAGTGNEMWALMAALLAATVFIALRWFDVAIARIRTG